MDSATNKSVDEAKKKPCVVENSGAFFWSVLFLIQENVSNCSQFEATLQLLQDFFSHSLKIRKNKSVSTSKPVIFSKLRHFFLRTALQMQCSAKKMGQNGLGES